MQANKELKVQFKYMTIRHNASPKYLGMTLDRTLSYKKCLETTKMKVRSKINLLQKLAGTGWGSNDQTLRIAALALVYSTAEYCAPVWINSSYTGKIYTHLNSAMRIITGYPKIDSTTLASSAGKYHNSQSQKEKKHW